MQILTLLTEKGGVGKTTTTTAIATLLAQMGHSVCVIDTDTQGHVATRLNHRAEDGFYHLMNDAAWQEVLRPISSAHYGGKGDPKLFIVPGAAATRHLDSDLNAHYLIQRLDEIRAAFDFVIFDTSPKLGAIHAALFVASDYILIPTECVKLSVLGLISTVNHITATAEKAHQAGLKVADILGIIPTKFNGSKSVHHQMHGFLQGRYAEQIPILNPIRFLTDWEKAEAKSMPIHVFNPSGAAAADMRALVRQLLQSFSAK